jgi:hypothetical protein
LPSGPNSAPSAWRPVTRIYTSSYLHVAMTFYKEDSSDQMYGKLSQNTLWAWRHYMCYRPRKISWCWCVINMYPHYSQTKRAVSTEEIFSGTIRHLQKDCKPQNKYHKLHVDRMQGTCMLKHRNHPSDETQRIDMLYLRFSRIFSYLLWNHCPS